MKFNKTKLKIALKIIDKSPEEVITWIRSCVRTNEIFMCENKKYWKKQDIEFEDHYYNKKRILIPRFVTDFLDYKEWKFSTATFSLEIIDDKELRNQFIKVLKELK
jgi:hypothetical protein